MLPNQQSDEMVKRPVTLKKFVREDILRLVEMAREIFDAERLTTNYEDNAVGVAINIPTTFGSSEFITEQLSEVMEKVTDELAEIAGRRTPATFCFRSGVFIKEETTRNCVYLVELNWCLNDNIWNPFDDMEDEEFDSAFD